MAENILQFQSGREAAIKGEGWDAVNGVDVSLRKE